MIRQFLVGASLAVLALGGSPALPADPAATRAWADAGQPLYTLRLAVGNCAGLDLVTGDVSDPVAPTISSSPPFEVYTFELQLEGTLDDLMEEPHAVVIEVQMGDVAEPFACGDVPAASNTSERVTGLVATESDALVGTAILVDSDAGRVDLLAFLLLTAPGSQDAIPGGTPTAEPDDEPDEAEPEGGV
jgi:hypothetical protein